MAKKDTPKDISKLLPIKYGHFLDILKIVKEGENKKGREKNQPLYDVITALHKKGDYILKKNPNVTRDSDFLGVLKSNETQLSRVIEKARKLGNTVASSVKKHSCFEYHDQCKNGKWLFMKKLDLNKGLMNVVCTLFLVACLAWSFKWLVTGFDFIFDILGNFFV